MAPKGLIRDLKGYRTYHELYKKIFFREFSVLAVRGGACIADPLKATLLHFTVSGTYLIAEVY